MDANQIRFSAAAGVWTCGEALKRTLGAAKVCGWPCRLPRGGAFGGRECPYLVLTFSISPFRSMPEPKGNCQNCLLN